MSTRPGKLDRHRPRLILVRHGQASLGTADYDRLSDLGQRQAGQVGRRLAWLLSGQAPLWSGTHRRHHQTVVSMAPDLQARAVPGLDEFSTFSLVRAAVIRAERLGLHRPDDAQLADPRTHLPRLLEWFPEVLDAWQEGHLAADDVDPWPAFRQRVLSPVAHWQEVIAAGQSVVVVSSAGVISTLVAELSGSGLEYQRRLAVAMYNASVSELYPDGDSWHPGVVNCIEHLEADSLVTLA